MLFALILSIFYAIVASVKPVKNCVDCKFYITNHLYAGTPDEAVFGKCGAFPITKIPVLYDWQQPLGIDMSSIDTDYRHCETARSFPDMCGEKAKMYKSRVFKKYSNSFRAVGGEPISNNYE